MPKVTIIQVIYNSRRFIEPVFSAIFSQTFKDFNVVAVISGNDDGGKELLMEKFPQVEIIDPGYNIGFAKGHNFVFDRYQSEFFQLVNPDFLMERNYTEEILKAFDDPKVGAATGKLYHRDFTRVTLVKHEGYPRLDSTGVVISKSGRARDRGQHEADTGQYDKDITIQAVSGAGAMYRRTALENVKYSVSSRAVASETRDPEPNNKLDPGYFSAKALNFAKASSGGLKNSGMTDKYEYFDEDFHSYWEDVDLTWRMANAGWKNIFVPMAIGYHGRGAGSSERGYVDVVGFIKHHKKLDPQVKRLNYQNHIFMYIKNSPYFYPQFFVREFFMFLYILFFETGTLKVVPKMLKLLPKMWRKRKVIDLNIISGQK